MDGSLLKRSDISVLSLMVLFSVKVVALLRMMLGRRSSWDLNSQGFVPLRDDLISTEFSVTDDWILDHKCGSCTRDSLLRRHNFSTCLRALF